MIYKMENAFVLCIVTLLCILVNSGEAYYLHQNKNDKDKRKDNVELHDNGNEVQKATLGRGLDSVENALDKEILARIEVEEGIDELISTFKAARKYRLNKRVSKRGGWWFCDWCDGSRLILFIADLLKCKCDDNDANITCKCSDGEILTQDMFEKSP